MTITSFSPDFSLAPGFPRWGAVFVLYRPNVERLLRHSEEIVSLGGEVMWVDNSPEPAVSEELFPAATLIRNRNAGGIAGGLNRGCERAQELGWEWALTMDQDSAVASDWLAPVLAAAQRVDPSTALLTPRHLAEPDARPEPLGLDGVLRLVPIRDAMTSGNLLRLSAWKEVSGFDEGLFIDQVDHDFCLRLVNRGFALYELPSVGMVHPLGETTYHRLPWRRRQPVTHHSPLRRYTMTRNRLIVIARHIRKHPSFAWREATHACHEFLCILLFETEKRLKTEMVIRGAIDAVLGKRGAPSAQVVRRATAAHGCGGRLGA